MLGHSLICCCINQPINALLPVVCIPVLEYVYLFKCGSFRGLLLLLLMHTNARENSFSDKLHEQVAFTAVWIHPAELERFVRTGARSTRVYANTGSFICRAELAVPGVLCVVVFFYPIPCPDIKQQREIGGWPILPGIRRVLLLFFLHSVALCCFCGLCLYRATLPSPTADELSALLCGYEENMQKTRSVTLLAPDA